MGSTPAGLLLQHCTPLLAALALIALSLWIGVLFSVSWVSGRAGLMADDADVGRLAVGLCRRWATPLLVLFVIVTGLFVAAAPGVLQVGRPLIAAGVALVTLLAVHASVWRRAALVASGDLGATHGEGARRIALVVSVAMILALVCFQIGAR